MQYTHSFLVLIIFGGAFTQCASPDSGQEKSSADTHVQVKPANNTTRMKLNAGIITSRLTETKSFYCDKLGFGVTFENDFYLLLHTPGHEAEISFLQPQHPSQQPVFQPEFQGKGVYLTIEVDDVDTLFETLKQRGITPVFPIRDEPWGDRHFAITDPNGIGIDFVKYAPPAQ